MQLYGVLVSEHFNAPFTKNSTRATPTLSFAVALTATVAFRTTIESLAGLLIETVGGRLSAAVVNPILFTDPLPRAR